MNTVQLAPLVDTGSNTAKNGGKKNRYIREENGVEVRNVSLFSRIVIAKCI